MHSSDSYSVWIHAVLNLAQGIMQPFRMHESDFFSHLIRELDGTAEHGILKYSYLNSSPKNLSLWAECQK